jgi:hypothetical protein
MDSRIYYFQYSCKSTPSSSLIEPVTRLAQTLTPNGSTSASKPFDRLGIEPKPPILHIHSGVRVASKLDTRPIYNRP